MSIIQKQATRPVAATRVTPRSPGRLRWGIGMLLGVGVFVNYFDRVNLSIAGPALSKEFHLSAAQLGLLRAFQLTRRSRLRRSGTLRDAIPVRRPRRAARGRARKLAMANSPAATETVA